MEINNIKKAIEKINCTYNKKIFTKTIEENVFMEYFTKNCPANYEITDEIFFLVKNFFLWLNKKEFEKHDQNGNIIKSTDIDFEKGFFIAGPTGTGKTTISNILFKTIYEIGIKYIYKDKYYILSPYISSEIEINKYYQFKGSFDYKYIGSLYIDDLGAAQPKILYMGNQLEPIQEIIYYRYDILKYGYTFISSNLPLQKLNDQYGDRTADRIKAMTNYFIIKNKNFRNI